MKDIIVAIDFSKCSLNALDFGIVIANKVGANIIMVNVDNTSSEESIFDTKEKNYKHEIIGYFEDLIKEYSSRLQAGKLRYKLKKGKVFQEIVMHAKNEQAYLIVTGTHGVTGFEEYWIGSNAYRIVTHAPCPVVTVRQDFKLSGSISKIVLPIDSTSETRQKLRFASEIAEIFDAEIHLLSVYPTILKSMKVKVDANMQKATQYLEENKVNFAVQNVTSDDLTKSTIKYAVDNSADLICVMTEQGETESKVFLGPNARTLVNYSQIPLLSIRPE